MPEQLLKNIGPLLGSGSNHTRAHHPSMILFEGLFVDNGEISF